MMFKTLLATAVVATVAATCDENAKSSSACLAATEDGEACAYCESAAVGPSCVKESDAQALPSSVFQCEYNSATYAAVQAPRNIHDRAFYESALVDHMAQFKLAFTTGAEFIHRVQVFADNLDIIYSHNAKDSTFKMGQNKYSHLTLSEFHDEVRLGGTRPPNMRRGRVNVHSAPKDLTSTPDEVDWVAAGAVTGAKDQGQCGSCWSFSATGALEGAYFKKTGTLESFSEQQLVSCDTVDGGCNGGWMDDAFTFVKQNGGLCTEADYAYTSGTTQKSGSCISGCSNNAAVAPSSFTDVQAGSVDALMSAVAQQPVSIAIEADQLAFSMYKSGVMTGTCGQNLDHGVLAVGYGTMDGTDYWKVKNSWGDSWGMEGYILIERSSADKCGVLDAASYPNL